MKKECGMTREEFFRLWNTRKDDETRIEITNNVKFFSVGGYMFVVQENEAESNAFTVGNDSYDINDFETE